MERLTKYGKTSHENGVCCTHFNSKACVEVAGNCSCNCKWEEEAWSKLATYEDAEEQGLLIRLPVAEGSTVYALGYIYECKYDYECILTFNKNKCEENSPCEHEDRIWRVRETVFNYKMLKSIGKTVFLTREEAEAALERMNNG